MHISSFRIIDYKSFSDSQFIELKPGINLFVGPNNAGKSAVLEAVSLTGKSNPSYYNTDRASLEKPVSTASLSVEIPSVEYKAILHKSDVFTLNKVPFRLPMTGKRGGEPEAYKSDDAEREAVIDAANNITDVTLHLTFQFHGTNPTTPNLAEELGRIIWTDYAGYDGSPRSYNLKNPLRVNTEGRIEILPTPATPLPNPAPVLSIFDILVSEFKSRLYFFKAQRPIKDYAPDGNTSQLKPDASNLAEVINNLNSDPHLKQKFEDLVRQVLPQIHYVSTDKVYETPGYTGLSYEILIREEPQGKPITLKDSGTGIGQILALLYVIATAENSKIIVIDELQSFLHPGAIRRLLALFREHNQHQYIISTHDANVIAGSGPSTISLVTKERGKPSTITPIDVNETRELKFCLNQVGANLSDIYGADFVLWVEGATEAACYPLIIEQFASLNLGGIFIVPVVHADELRGDDTEGYIKIYERLSNGAAVRPEATGFLLDCECLEEQKKKELIHRAKGRLGFLEYRMYENYLIDSDAIAAILNDLDKESEKKFTPDEIQSEIDIVIQDKSLYCKKRLPDDVNNVWRQVIDGGKALHQIFAKLVETRFQYDPNKRIYGYKLTKWILEHKPDLLEPVAEQLKIVISLERE